MELIKCKPPNSITEVYLAKGRQSCQKNNLLGFKEGLPVIETIELGEMATVKKFELKVDPVTGEKFMNFNGKILKVVVQGSKLAKQLVKNERNKFVTVNSKNTNCDNNLGNSSEDPLKIDEIKSDKKIKSEASEVCGDHNAAEQSESEGASNKMDLTYRKCSVSTNTNNRTVNKCYDRIVQTDKTIYEDKGVQVPENGTLVDNNSDIDFMGINLEFDLLMNQSDLLDNLAMSFEATRKTMNKPQTNDKNKFFIEMRSALELDSNGNMPIHDAVLKNDLKKVKKCLVTLKARQTTCNVFNQNKLTPLQLAVVSEASTDIITCLLEDNADASVTDQEGNSALHLAVTHNNKLALDVICRFSVYAKKEIDYFNYDGLTPLMLCCLNAQHECAKTLLHYHSKPNVRDKKSGRTALFHAAEAHDIEMVRLLLSYNADTKIRNFFGTSSHDAMFEIEEIPKEIKELVLGVKKRKAQEDKPQRVNKILKTFATYEKIKIS